MPSQSSEGRRISRTPSYNGITADILIGENPAGSSSSADSSRSATPEENNQNKSNSMKVSAASEATRPTRDHLGTAPYELTANPLSLSQPTQVKANKLQRGGSSGSGSSGAGGEGAATETKDAVYA